MKHLLKKVLILAVVIAVLSLMTSGSDVKGQMADLISARIDVMNGYFCGHINYYDALEQIRQVEMGRLLDEDVQAMRDYFQTDIEQVNKYKIKDIELTNGDENLVCAVATIAWQVSGTEGTEEIEEIYSVIMEKDEKNYKLVQFF